MWARVRAWPRVCSGGAKHRWPLQGRAEVNVGDIREEGNGRQIVNRAGQEVLLTAVLFHEGVCLAGVKEDLIGSHQQDTWNHTLGEKKPHTNVSPREEKNTGLTGSKGSTHPPYGPWCSGRAVWGTARPLGPPPHRIQVAEQTSRAVHQASAPSPHPVINTTHLQQLILDDWESVSFNQRQSQ